MAFFFRNRAKDQQAQQNFDQLAAYLTKLGLNDIAIGSDNVTGTGATQVSKTITHGMSTTPRHVDANATNDTSLNATVDAIGATTFQVNLLRVDGATFSSNKTFSWIAFA